MARRPSRKMPWHATPFFGGGHNSGWHVPQDNVPSVFGFVDQTDVTASATITSAPITVAGIDLPTSITVSGGTYNKNGGSYTSSAGTVVNGDVIRVRHTASASSLTAVNTVLTIGGVSDTFTSTTAMAAPTPLGIINFASGTYTVGVTSYSLADLIGDGEFPFDPDWIEPGVGLICNESPSLRLLNQALALANDPGGCVILIKGLIEDPGVDAGHNSGWDLQVYDAGVENVDGFLVSITDGEQAAESKVSRNTGDDWVGLLGWGEHRIAWKLAGGVVEGSSDGGVVVSSVDEIVSPTQTNFIFRFYEGSTVTAIEFYNPSVNLPALSAL